MPKSITSAESIAAIKSLEACDGQSYHRDSKEPGNSGLTAVEEDQHIDILVGGFQATVILEEVSPDRKKATDLVRSRLVAPGLASEPAPAATQPRVAKRPRLAEPEPSHQTSSEYSDEEWDDRVEPLVWMFLVHEEFKARRVRDFEAVRFPIRRGQTIVLDSRCPHSGAPWTGACRSRKRLYRTHFYGFRKDIKTRRASVAEKDEQTTVDLCDRDHFPIVAWAQRGKAGPIFASL